MVELGMPAMRPGIALYKRIEWLRLAQVSTAALAIIAFIYIRNYSLVSSPELWAEDFDVYFVGDRLFGLRALLIPYNGFIQFCCRVVAFIAGFAPFEAIPRLYASFFLASILWTGCLVFASTAFRGWGKVAAVLAYIACPVGSEIFYGMCYMQWVMGPAVALALYERNPKKSHGIALASTFAMVGLSSPFTIIAAPFVAIKAFTERTLYSKILAATTLAAGLMQIVYVVRRASSTSHASTLLEKATYFSSIFFRWLVGYEDIARTAAYNVSALTIVAGAWFIWRNRDEAARPVFYFLSFGLLFLAVSAYTAPPIDHVNQFQNYGRYFYMPVVFALWTIVSIIRRDLVRQLTFVVALLWLFAMNVGGVGQHVQNVNWPATANCIRTQMRCEIDVNPTVLGRRVAPTDPQLRTMTDIDRAGFSVVPH